MSYSPAAPILIGMTRKKLAVILLAITLSSPLWAYKIMYAEQYYELFHTHFYRYPEDLNENIVYLEYALKTPFVNPLNALTPIETPEEWERYRKLFALHVNLKLVEQYRLLGSKYDKFHAYFYNYPFKEQNLKSLRYAESYYETALHYWGEAQNWAEQIEDKPWFTFENLSNWEDELYRMNSGELDYGEFIGSDMERLREVRAAFEAMDENTY